MLFTATLKKKKKKAYRGKLSVCVCTCTLFSPCMCRRKGWGGIYRMILWMHELQYGKLNLNANAAVFLDSQ